MQELREGQVSVETKYNLKVLYNINSNRVQVDYEGLGPSMLCTLPIAQPIGNVQKTSLIAKTSELSVKRIVFKKGCQRQTLTCRMLSKHDFCALGYKYTRRANLILFLDQP